MVVLHLIVVINTLDMVLLLHLPLHTVVTKLILEASTVAMILLLHHHLLLHTVVLLLILEPNTIQAMKLMMKTTVTLTTIATMTMAVAEAVAEAAAARAVLHAAKMEKCIAVAKVLLPVIIANKSIVPVAQVPGVVNGVALSSVTMKRIRMHQNVILKEAIVAVEQSLINVIMEYG